MYIETLGMQVFSKIWLQFFGVGASAWIIIRVKSLCQDQSGINSIDDIALKHSSVGDFTYNPKTGQFQRSPQLENIVGFPSLHGEKQQIDFGNGQIYQVADGLLNRLE